MSLRLFCSTPSPYGHALYVKVFAGVDVIYFDNFNISFASYVDE